MKNISFVFASIILFGCRIADGDKAEVDLNWKNENKNAMTISYTSVPMLDATLEATERLCIKSNPDLESRFKNAIAGWDKDNRRILNMTDDVKENATSEFIRVYGQSKYDDYVAMVKDVNGDHIRSLTNKLESVLDRENCILALQAMDSGSYNLENFDKSTFDFISEYYKKM